MGGTFPSSRPRAGLPADGWGDGTNPAAYPPEAERGSSMPAARVARRRFRRGWSICALMAALAPLAPWSGTNPAFAQEPVVIDFETLPDGSAMAPGIFLTDQLSPLGVTFNGPSVQSYDPGFAASESQAVEPCFAEEISCSTPVRLTFASPQSAVSLLVGSAFPLSAVAAVELRAFDDLGTSVGVDTAELPPSESPVPIRTPLSVSDATGSIRVVDVTFTGETQNFGLAVDNVTFVPAAAPSAGSDLELSAVTRSIEGGVLRLSFVVTNLGPDASPEVDVAAEAPGWEAREAVLPTLNPDGSVPVTMELSIPGEVRGGTSRFQLEVDPDELIRDPNRDNNLQELDVFVPPTIVGETTSPTPTRTAVSPPPTPQVTDVPPGTTADEEAGIPLWPFVVGGAVLLAIALAIAIRVLRARRPEKPRWAEAEPRYGGPPREDEMAGPDVGPTAPARVVSTGFSTADTPDVPLGADMPLAPGVRHLFWLSIGEPVAGAIDEQPAPIDLSTLPSDATLTVALFAFEGDLLLEPYSTIGLLRMAPDDRVVVSWQPGGKGPVGSSQLGQRLFFPVWTPPVPGEYGMRANIYYRRVLLQSRRVTVRVDAAPTRTDGALRAEVDYTYTRSMDFARVAARSPHRLSLMVNRAGSGDAGFMFFADDGQDRDIACPANLGEAAVSEHVDRARQALRDVAFEADPAGGKPRYRYAGPVAIDQLRRDLIALATAGARIYFSIRRRLACGGGPEDPVARLEAAMLRSGYVEVVSKVSPSFVLPVGILYDHPVDDAVPLDRMTLCDRFTAALGAGSQLEALECFTTGCPHRAEMTVVCPSGFWGFRHAVGLPASLARDGDGSRAGDGAPVIRYRSNIVVDAVVATDLDFEQEHLEALQGILPGLGLPAADTRDEAFALLARPDRHAQIVYFYCHGGLREQVAEGSGEPIQTPYLRVGGPEEFPITVLNVQTAGFPWRESRPLVFLNGCHTTALDPRHALQFVSAFVEDAYASGVIGTEITIYEPLATEFAREFFERVVQPNWSVGYALRSARLALLSRGNPLGLVYVPFVAPDLHLERADA